MLKPPEDAEQREQHQTLTKEEIAEKKWHKVAHDAVMATSNTHAQKSKEHQERKQKIVDEESKARERRLEERAHRHERERQREREHPLNKAYEMRRSKRDEARKRINDIAAQYDRVLEVEEKRQVAKDMMLIHASEKKDGEVGGEGENEETEIDGELSKIERNEDRENELEKISELEKMPLALEPPNVLVDLPSASSARRSGNFFNFFSSSSDKNEDDENNYAFGTFLSFLFVVIVLVVFAVVRRRRRKKILLAANRAYAEGRSFIV